MSVLSIDRLEAIFDLGRGDVVHALRGVDLEVREGEFLVLLGPSGCGKTTMLRSIAGLERPSAGTIRIDGETVFDAPGRTFVPPDRRPIAMVFQSYAIWPHMDVFENVAFPLRAGRARLDPATIRRRVADILDMLGLTTMADRQVTTLSGGQQQRVALARALALQPRVLLMDEPLSNLDFKLQVRLRAQLRDLMHRLNLTTVYVTHNQAEALETGDRVAVMDQGEIIQMGAPADIYHRPHSEFVARFIGEMNLVPGTLRSLDSGIGVVETALGRTAAAVPAASGLRPGDECVLGVRPEDFEVVGGTGDQDQGDQDQSDQDKRDNVIGGTLAASHYMGEAMLHTLRSGNIAVQFKTHHATRLAEGAALRLRVAPDRAVAVRPGGGRLTEEAEDLARVP